MSKDFGDEVDSSIYDCHLADNRSPERVHAATVAGRVSRRVSGDGAHGREPMPGDPDGSGSRAYVIPPLPDAVRHQALALRRHHPQGGWLFARCAPMKIA